MEYTHDSASVSNDQPQEGFDAFSSVKDAIKNKDFAKAQSLLDDNFDRGGEWHYYQAIIYYEKSWLNESRKQLEIALSLDPGNQKYQKALENMKKKILDRITNQPCYNDYVIKVKGFSLVTAPFLGC